MPTRRNRPRTHQEHSNGLHSITPSSSSNETVLDDKNDTQRQDPVVLACTPTFTKRYQEALIPLELNCNAVLVERTMNTSPHASSAVVQLSANSVAVLVDQKESAAFARMYLAPAKVTATTVEQRLSGLCEQISGHSDSNNKQTDRPSRSYQNENESNFVIDAILNAAARNMIVHVIIIVLDTNNEGSAQRTSSTVASEMACFLLALSNTMKCQFHVHVLGNTISKQEITGNSKQRRRIRKRGKATANSVFNELATIITQLARHDSAISDIASCICGPTESNDFIHNGGILSKCSPVLVISQSGAHNAPNMEREDIIQMLALETSTERQLYKEYPVLNVVQCFEITALLRLILFANDFQEDDDLGKKVAVHQEEDESLEPLAHRAIQLAILCTCNPTRFQSEIALEAEIEQLIPAEKLAGMVLGIVSYSDLEALYMLGIPTSDDP